MVEIHVIQENKPGTSLVCVARDEISAVALRFACVKAKKRGGQVAIMHVTEPAEEQTLLSVADRIRHERRQEAETLLAKLAAMAHETTGITPSIVVREGRLGEEIIQTALEDPHINMLVLGAAPQSAGRGKLIAWLSGQLGEKLLIPMTLVPGNLTDQQIEELS